MSLFCGNRECERPALFKVIGRSGDPLDYWHSCESCLGHLMSDDIGGSTVKTFWEVEVLEETE